jgi:hypothetical protein
MHLFQNSAEAKAGIKDFIKKQTIQFSYTSTRYRLGFSGWVFRDGYYLNSFNRIIETHSSFTFSYLTTKEVPRHQKMIKASIEAAKTEREDLHYEEADTPYTVKNVRKGSGLIDTTFIASIFSSDFIEEHNLSPENMIAQVEASREQQQHLIDQQEPVAMLRWQEIREDLRTILSISPIDGTMQLSYCFLIDSYFTPRTLQNFNPITGYYENRFNYEYGRFNRYVSKHGLRFLEMQGYEHSPQNGLNEQVFQITFNNYSEGTMESIARASYRSLIKESKPLLHLLSLVYGIDMYRRHHESLPMDAHSEAQRNATNSLVPIMGKSLSLKKSIIGRIGYYSPENDIHISYTPKFENDDNGHDFVVFVVNMRILPYDPNHPEKNNSYLHPIIYELEK